MLATAFTILAASLFVGLLLMMLVISVNNRLVGLFRRCENAFAQLDVHMRRRYELISPLADMLQHSTDLDRKALKAVRGSCQAAYSTEQLAAQTLRDQQALRQLIVAETELDGALSRLLDSQEWDSQEWDSQDSLHVDDQVASLRDELSSAESRILFAREAYNDFAAHYNAGRGLFPARLIANRLGFGELQLFRVASESRQTASRDEVEP